MGGEGPWHIFHPIFRGEFSDKFIKLSSYFLFLRIVLVADVLTLVGVLILQELEGFLHSIEECVNLLLLLLVNNLGLLCSQFVESGKILLREFLNISIFKRVHLAFTKYFLNDVLMPRTFHLGLNEDLGKVRLVNAARAVFVKLAK